jgi:peptidyl-prolyl cis-trans isomerase SurA
VKKKYADTTISRMAYEINPLSLAIKTGKFQHGDHIVTELVKWKKGKYMVEKDGKYYYVVITKTLPAQPKALAEVRGPITSEYQTMLEHKWIDELKQKYPVKINQETFDKFLNSLPR